jgi:hypothetical protein
MLPRCDHSLPYSAKVKNAWSYTSTPIRLHAAILNYVHGQLYLYLIMKYIILFYA